MLGLYTLSKSGGRTSLCRDDGEDAGLNMDDLPNMPCSSAGVRPFFIPAVPGLLHTIPRTSGHGGQKLGAAAPAADPRHPRSDFFNPTKNSERRKMQ